MSFWDNFGQKTHLIAAHRGERSLRAENTMAAFESALKKADFFETDVSLTKDGIPVIIHDDTLLRTSNVSEISHFKKPYKVYDYSYKELLELDFSSWFGKKDPFGTIKNGDVKREDLSKDGIQRISTLKEILEFSKREHFPINVEIKNMKNTPFDDTITKTVLKTIKDMDMDTLVLISSFNHTYIYQASLLAPDITRAALQEKKHPDNIISYLKSINADGYHPSDDISDRENIKKLLKAGFFVNVFTVNDKKRQQELYGWGVKAVFSDFLQKKETTWNT